jgi:hypothetical protein
VDTITDDNVTGFLKLFKIECDTTDPIKAIVLYLQKYKTLYSKEDWIAMGKDVEFSKRTWNQNPLVSFRGSLSSGSKEKLPLDSWPPTEPIVLPRPFTMVKLGRRSMKPGAMVRKSMHRRACAHGRA